ncbi:MAG: hypothetical protein JST44_11155 [Cyanobacteria bacterium SZAS LIN-5]|nr:hypothetical protein [Cyanobacteria bacterium SZAS LIN-5]
MVSDRGIRGSESAATNDNSVAHAATEAYNNSIRIYSCVFTNKATPDSTKTDAQLNNELNSAGSIFGAHDTTSGAIGDLQRGIKSDSRTRHDLMNAIQDASFGNIDSAMMHLRQATTDLNAAGGKIDSGLAKLGDGGQSFGSQTIQKAMVNEADCTQNIQKAEQLLREGDTEGAINAMQKGIREVAHRQHQTRDGIASLQGNNNAPDWQNYGPQQPGSNYQPGSYYQPESYGSGNTGFNSSNGNPETSFYSGYNRGDQNFDSQQHVIRSNNGGWNSTQPFTPDGNNNYQPYLPGSSYNGDFPISTSGDTNRSPSLSFNLPNPLDFQSGMPNPADIVAHLPNPFDMFGGSDSNSGGGLPNPADIVSHLPNPFDMFGGSDSKSGSGLPNPFNMPGLPNPTDLLGGNNGSGGLSNPIENLVKPPKSSKDIVHKILDPIGLFG